MEVFCYPVTITSQKAGFQVIYHQCLMLKKVQYDAKHQEDLIVTITSIEWKGFKLGLTKDVISIINY